MSEKKGGQNQIIAGIMLAIIGLAALTIGTYLIFSIVESTNALGESATGTFTFTGNVSNGELVNITNGGTVYTFEFNTTANGSAIVCQTTGCIPVNVSTGNNDSVQASGQLTAAINANASVAALVTAVNTTNTTTITATAKGTAYNSIAISTNASLVSCSASTMTGGLPEYPGMQSILDYVTIVLPLFGFAIMAVGFGLVLTSLGILGGGASGRRQ